MIIVNLTGGLGNQMFQYATGRSLSISLNTTLKLDVSKLKEQPDRRFDLNYFKIQADIATKREVELFKGETNGLLKRTIYRLVKLFPHVFHHYVSLFRLSVRVDQIKGNCFEFNEQQFHFDERFLWLKGDVYLNGYWQSERYFKNIERVIEEEFKLKNIYENYNQNMFRMINSSESVGVHIRRGDYISSPEVSMIHGVLPNSYYMLGMAILSKKISNPFFFIFSDDTKWVKQHMKIPFRHQIVEQNDSYSCHEDLYLMSRCRHNIIANSSFSWWAGWLNRNPDKIIIAPQKWFKTEDRDTRDLVPASWIKV